jgi:hypothetical protein
VIYSDARLEALFLYFIYSLDVSPGSETIATPYWDYVRSSTLSD